MTRPQPPDRLYDPDYLDIEFAPAPELVEWLRATFLNISSPLYNIDHTHLEQATIGALWTNAENSRRGITVVGTAELGKPPSSLSKWAKARWEFQNEQWFGEQPDFVLTFYAPYAATIDHLSFCALVEHEAYHCGQAKDKYGFPAFNQQTGKPRFAMRGHDVEEFVDIVRRYGVGAGAGRTREFIEAANLPPTIGAALAAGACGYCLAKAA